MKEERNNNGRGIFYGVIGVATLIVAIIGATFAYFTAQQSNNNTIKGNAASISFGLTVEKVTTVDETKGGMIPMSNSMVEAAVSNANGACLDSNGNAVCQVYKVTVTNTSTATLFVDGYVSLDGGLKTSAASTDDANAPTVMRWAQVFVSGSAYSTAGTSTVRPDNGSVTIATIDQGAASNSNAANAHNATNLYTSATATNFATGTTVIGGNTYDVINKNYIRSSYDVTGSYTHSDLDSALVFSQNLAPTSDATNSKAEIYFVVWLSETGTNQTPTPEEALNFFNGTVIFNSAQGGEVTATFNGYTRVAPTDNTQSGS